PAVALAVALEPVADDLLGAPGSLGAARHGVDLGSVHEIEPGLERHVDLGVSLGLGVLAAPGHGAQAKFGDPQIGAAKRLQFHVMRLEGWYGRAASLEYFTAKHSLGCRKTGPSRKCR